MVLQTHESYLTSLQSSNELQTQGRGNSGGDSISTTTFSPSGGDVGKEEVGGGDNDDDEDALSRLPFHLYWGMKKMFRLSLPEEFNRRALGFNSDSTSPRRMDILEKRWAKKLYFRGPVPLEDEHIDESMYEEVEDPLKDDVSRGEAINLVSILFITLHLRMSQ